MHAMTIRGGLLGLALAAALGMGGGALAETMSFKGFAQRRKRSAAQ